MVRPPVLSTLRTPPKTEHEPTIIYALPRPSSPHRKRENRRVDFNADVGGRSSLGRPYRSVRVAALVLAFIPVLAISLAVVSPSPPLPRSLESLSDFPGPGPTHVGVVHRVRSIALSHDRIQSLIAQFALAVPERQLSITSL